MCVCVCVALLHMWMDPMCVQHAVMKTAPKGVWSGDVLFSLNTTGTPCHYTLIWSEEQDFSWTCGLFSGYLTTDKQRPGTWPGVHVKSRALSRVNFSEEMFSAFLGVFLKTLSWDIKANHYAFSATMTGCTAVICFTRGFGDIIKKLDWFL